MSQTQPPAFCVSWWAQVTATTGVPINFAFAAPIGVLAFAFAVLAVYQGISGRWLWTARMLEGRNRTLDLQGYSGR